ncbi:single-stranded-DNA-specific exonuclease RecJ [Candidatus Saccharibacteria bacterium]|nr:single-stranded-DNA-specific exonuclease RecJ [Candidatus Saccharibacteria bacterium]
MTEIFKKLLAQRGLDENFLYPKYDDLFDSFLMLDMKKAVERIEVAKENDEKIAIFGDYDADGVTASAVLIEALTQFGCRDVKVFLPDRFEDGYGMNKSAVPRILDYGASLVITVDNGSGSEPTIKELKEAGIDTIVTDHHEIPELPKSAIAVINPKRDDERYGKRMAGVGVAFMLARALNATKNGGKCDGQEKWLLDLVVIGTICDSMVLRGENRILSYFGMLVLSKTRRVGIKELAKVAGVKLSKINTHAIGFQLGPRLNAAGRMKSADLAFELLMSKDRAKAFSLAQELEELNLERRRIQEEASRDIDKIYDEEDRVVVASGNWHEGVLGIIAGQIVEKYHKPAFALTKVGRGELKGSGRSFGDFSLADVIKKCKSILLTGGGHAMACGISLKTSDLKEFKARVNSFYDSLKLKDQERLLEQATDIELKDLESVDERLYDEICLLEPFGEGNAEPLFESDLLITGRRILKDKHLSLIMRDKKDNVIKMIAFYAPEEWLNIDTNSRVRAQFSLTKNEWQGVTKIEGAITRLKQI